MEPVIQNKLAFKTAQEIQSVEDYKFEPIKGYPMLHWNGKRPFTSTQFYPAQIKENYGTEIEGWMNKIFWGDNLQVMSHLLKEFRGQIDLIYIDPPFDSKADYKKKIQAKGKNILNNSTAFEEKQYSDIWNNDAYLQFMYERLVLLRELLSNTGSIYIHCDYHKVHHLKCIMDEIFGPENFKNDIKWVRSTNPKGSQHDVSKFDPFTDNILYYTKSSEYYLNINAAKKQLTKAELEEKYHRIDEKGRFYDGPIIRSLGMGARPNLVYEYKGYTPPASGWRVNKQELIRIDEEGNLGWSKNNAPFRKIRPEDDKGHPIGDIWDDISLINSQADERLGYPTQKPEELLERILTVSSKKGDLIFDCFMGSGTAQAVAMKSGRRFIGADINLGAIQTTTKRLINLSNEIQGQLHDETKYIGFSVFNVNHYEIFRNPIQAKEILIKALEIQPLPNSIYDGEKDGKMVKIMPINRISTRADLNELITNFDYKAFEKANEKNPGRPVEHLLLVCMGHEPDLAASLQSSVPYKLDIEVVDILRDNARLEFKRDAEAEIVIEGGKIIIREFYPMNLLQKLSLMKDNVENWKELVDSVMIDFNYDGAVFEPKIVDVPEDSDLVSGIYNIPANAGTIRVKITDLLSETLELTVKNG